MMDDTHRRKLKLIADAATDHVIATARARMALKIEREVKKTLEKIVTEASNEVTRTYLKWKELKDAAAKTDG